MHNRAEGADKEKPKPAFLLHLLQVPLIVEPEVTGASVVCWGQLQPACESQMLNFQEFYEPVVERSRC